MDRKKLYKSIARYKKKAVRRISFEVSKAYFDAVLFPAIQKSGESTNGYIKKAINDRIGLSQEEIDELIAQYKEQKAASENSGEDETECDGDSCPIHYPE